MCIDEEVQSLDENGGFDGLTLLRTEKREHNGYQLVYHVYEMEMTKDLMYVLKSPGPPVSELPPEANYDKYWP